MELTTQELRHVIALRDLQDDLLRWILDHGEYAEYEDGSMIMESGKEVTHMYFILEGSIHFYMDIHGRQVFYFTFANDEATGGVSGLLPYSRMKSSPGYIYAVGSVKLLRIHKNYFPELERLYPDFIQRLIGYMTERARAFATIQLQHEKVSALGKLSAGIAHELNNPASAISRIAAELAERVKQNFELTEKLLAHSVKAEHIHHLGQLVESRKQGSSVNGRVSALDRMEREELIAEWLVRQGMDGNDGAAETFADAGFTREDLEDICSGTGGGEMPQLISWLENLLSSQRMIKDLSEASGRISKLVNAIRSHVHMDRTNELQPTNIHEGIDNTLVLLGHKLREKNISVIKQYCDQPVEVPAYVSELNQVWTNLIDNAIYAVDRNGELRIETNCNSRFVEVRVIDNGTGIPAEIQPRIFDPFFTTKKPGVGTGIGLDIVSRIINDHRGEIRVNSIAGRTEFIICLPRPQPAAPEHQNQRT